MDSVIRNRTHAVRTAMAASELNGLLVSNEENRFYLSGFTGKDSGLDESAGALIITPDHLILATDSRFTVQAASEATGYQIVTYKQGLSKELPGIVDNLGIHRLGVESTWISHKHYNQLADELACLNPPPKLIPTENIVETLRRIKSPDEVDRTCRALRVAEQAFATVLKTLCPGLTEKEVAWALEKAMRENGADGLSFPVIVAAGPNSALPHAIPTDRRIQAGEPVLFDWGARLAGYCSDTSRTVILGKPDERFMKIFDTVVTARDMAIAAIRAGAGGTAIDRIARDHIDQMGFAGAFGHSLGHGTGLAIHEAPRLSPVKDERLEAGMIVTVEPGIYLPDWGGVRMENQVLVTDDGARVLNSDSGPFDPVIRVP
ncbi:aminopeptidase P family protein [Desulfosarcina sp. OttesenSCG-928-G10]|nr:aminopeptidase P family protein [Desulfosarcina sp. OttesenSCG-928-G10]MDL2275255.1 aminopeptidase P family protein [Desulfosarcina sp. OttesenSCG-928-G10]MDL2321533.1 aminopeptidase P family protein [Desulfosarcina sp. OttesenSCG-928-B08]